MRRHGRSLNDDRRKMLVSSELLRKPLDLKIRSESIGAKAVGALAIGALAIGALAIGAVAIKRLAIARTRIRRVEVDEFVVRRLHITDEVRGPPQPWPAAPEHSSRGVE